MIGPLSHHDLVRRLTLLRVLCPHPPPSSSISTPSFRLRPPPSFLFSLTYLVSGHGRGIRWDSGARLESGRVPGSGKESRPTTRVVPVSGPTRGPDRRLSVGFRFETYGDREAVSWSFPKTTVPVTWDSVGWTLPTIDTDDSSTGVVPDRSGPSPSSCPAEPDGHVTLPEGHTPRHPSRSPFPYYRDGSPVG